jgi:hypothetical protein
MRSLRSRCLQAAECHTFYQPTYTFNADGTYSCTMPADNRGPMSLETGTYSLSGSALTINGLRIGLDGNGDGTVDDSELQENIYTWPATTVTFVGEGMIWVFSGGEATHQWGLVRN